MEKEMTIFEKFDMFQQLCFLPAVTLLPLIRKRLGLRVCEGWWFHFMIIVLLIAGDVLQSKPLMIFAGLSWLAGQWQSWNRAREMKQGAEWHTRSSGISFFEYLPLPRLLIEEERLYRFADPIVVFVIGGITYHFTTALGAWLMFSGMCLRVFDEYAYRFQRNKLLDNYDNSLNAGAMSANLQELKDGQPEPPQSIMRKDPASKGRGHGAYSDLQQQIAKRHSEAAARAETDKQANIAKLREEAKRLKAETAARAEDLQRTAQTARERVEEAQAAMDQRLKDDPGHGPAPEKPVIIREERETVIETQQIVQPVIIAIEPPPPATLITAGQESLALNGHTPNVLAEPRKRPALPAPKDESE